jgi:GntR family transcriptional regulator/MocR family aminotransferase
MHVLVRLPAGTDDEAIARRAQRAGLAPSPLSMSAVTGASGAGLLLSFTNVPADHAARLVELLARGLDQ